MAAAWVRSLLDFVRWTIGRSPKNLSIALPASLKMSVHDALTLLEMGLLPVKEFSGKTGAQYRNPDDPVLRIDFLTPSIGRPSTDGIVRMDDLGLALQPLKFMEFSLEGTAAALAPAAAWRC